MGSSINYDDLRLKHSVEANVASQFLHEVEECFYEFIKQYEYFGPVNIITRWIASKIRLYKKEVHACNRRAEDLLTYLREFFGASYWYDFKYQIEYTNSNSGIPFPHAFIYVEVHWHDHNGSDNILCRRYDPYYGKVIRDWKPTGNFPYYVFPDRYIAPDFKPWF